MQSTEAVRVQREGWQWFWIIVTTLMLMVSVVVAVGVARNWPRAPTYADLVEQFREFENIVVPTGGTCWVGFDTRGDDPSLIETIAIEQNVPRDVWHKVYVPGNPERVFLTGMTLTEGDWRVLSSSDRLCQLKLEDCRFEGAFVSLDQMEKLDWLTIWPGDIEPRPNQEVLDVLIDSLPSAPHLTDLFIGFEPTDEQLQRLVQNAPQLESLRLSGVTEADCQHLARLMHLHHLSGVPEEGFHHLAKLDHLYWLNVDALSESSVPVLATFPRLSRISVGKVPSVECCIRLFEEVESLNELHLPCYRCSEFFNDDAIAILNSNGIGIETPPESNSHLYRLPSSQ